jgi:hypothetical protein
MLFDLRGRRRNAVKVIYLGLAVLLGGGLVLFGIGGDVQGGLFDAFRDNTSASKQFEERRDKAAERTEVEPRNAAAWAELASAEYQLAGQTEGFNPNTGEFTGDARKRAEAAKAAWERHLALAGDKPNADVAGTMKNALVQLGDLAGAVRAQEIVLEARGDDAGFGDFAQLAQLAYQAGQTRKGDLAADRAVELAPKDQRDDLKAALEQAKTGGAAAGATTTPGS